MLIITYILRNARGKTFSEEKRHLILSLKDGMSRHDIARHMKRSFSSVAKFLRFESAYGMVNRTTSFTRREERLILRTASNLNLPAKAIAEKCEKERIIKRCLKESENLTRKKLKRKPKSQSCQMILYPQISSVDF